MLHCIVSNPDRPLIIINARGSCPDWRVVSKHSGIQPSNPWDESAFLKGPRPYVPARNEAHATIVHLRAVNLLASRCMSGQRLTYCMPCTCGPAVFVIT